MKGEGERGWERRRVSSVTRSHLCTVYYAVVSGCSNGVIKVIYRDVDFVYRPGIFSPVCIGEKNAGTYLRRDDALLVMKKYVPCYMEYKLKLIFQLFSNFLFQLC